MKKARRKKKTFYEKYGWIWDNCFTSFFDRVIIEKLIRELICVAFQTDQNENVLRYIVIAFFANLSLWSWLDFHCNFLIVLLASIMGATLALIDYSSQEYKNEASYFNPNIIENGKPKKMLYDEYYDVARNFHNLIIPIISLDLIIDVFVKSAQELRNPEDIYTVLPDIEMTLAICLSANVLYYILIGGNWIHWSRGILTCKYIFNNVFTTIVLIIICVIGIPSEFTYNLYKLNITGEMVNDFLLYYTIAHCIHMLIDFIFIDGIYLLPFKIGYIHLTKIPMAICQYTASKYVVRKELLPNGKYRTYNDVSFYRTKDGESFIKVPSNKFYEFRKEVESRKDFYSSTLEYVTLHPIWKYITRISFLIFVISYIANC